MMTPLTIAEKILSAKCGRSARAGEIVVCDVDVVIGTDGSGPMAIDYFERMGGAAGRVKNPSQVFFSLDHYAPPNTPQTRAFHERIRAFARTQGAAVFDVGDGISHQVVAERALALPGDLVVGADSHTVTLGALNCFAIGVGSSDLAAAMFTGQIWLRVPETIRIRFVGSTARRVPAKDIALALVGALGADGADYCAIEFAGELDNLDADDRWVISNLMVEAGAKAALFPCDATTREYFGRRTSRTSRTSRAFTPVTADADARYARELTVDLDALGMRIALPHAPDNVVPLAGAAGTPVQMVFVGTCTGGRASDFRAMRAAFDVAGGTVAAGVKLVLTPASRDVLDELTRDGTVAHLVAAGAEVTTAGCGACCGTSGVIPSDGDTVLSTANRNFQARMGNASARIFLASPAVCGTAAATGEIPAAIGAAR